MQCIYANSDAGRRCGNSSRTRGLCHGHYQQMRAMVRKGVADEDDLVERGLLLPKGVAGGSSTNGHEAFVMGCPSLGFAAVEDAAVMRAAAGREPK
jgi:hypothetical protein